MDFKTVRQTMTVNEVVYSTNGEIPVDEDFVLPDFYPEITKILKHKALLRIASKSANSMSVEIDGHICITLLYSDKNGCLHSFEHISPFNKTFDSDVDVTGGTVHCKIKQEYMNCRALTERKAAVHGAFSICLQVKAKKQHDIIVDIDDDTVQVNRGECKFLNAIGNSEKNYLIEQELELSNSHQSIDSIIRCDAVPVITEIKAVRNKAAVKGNLALSLLYSSGKQCIPYKSVIPFSQFIDIQGISEECICTGKVQLCFLEVKPRSVDGEWRSMSLCAKLNITVETFCDGEVPVINDAYSTRYNLDIQHTKVNLEKIAGHINDSFMFKKTFDFQEGTIVSVIDSWSEIETETCRFEEGIIKVSGNVTVCFLVNDKDGRACYLEKKSDFEYSKNIDFKLEGNPLCSPVIEPVTSSFAIISDSCIEYRIEYKINLSLCEERVIPLLTEINADDKEKDRHNDGCSLVIFYANKGESVWEIAKRYNADIKDLKEINSIESENLQSNKKLMIPRV
ncbi:MAG: DUF3794 domain-containing protein [Ruminococcaceae bacterium]|nr:DUF3794 domain-containing protein [Oscillospiraceae bacterium]